MAAKKQKTSSGTNNYYYNYIKEVEPEILYVDRYENENDGSSVVVFAKFDLTIGETAAITASAKTALTAALSSSLLATKFQLSSGAPSTAVLE